MIIAVPPTKQVQVLLDDELLDDELASGAPFVLAPKFLTAATATTNEQNFKEGLMSTATCHLLHNGVLKQPGSIVKGIAPLSMKGQECECKSQRREALRNAPSVVQEAAARKARQYRRNYAERAKAGRDSPKSPHQNTKAISTASKEPPSLERPVNPGPSKEPQPSAPLVKPRPAPSPFGSSPGKLTDLNLARPRPPSGSTDRTDTPPTPTPRSRKSQGATPKSLTAIAVEDSPDEDESDDEPPYTGYRITGIDRWWEYLDADGPLRNVTGHPDYVPQSGQQAYIKGGRRYWF
ncbi:hypothetical protein B0H16DRAFT_1752806 [Mycena metata]|uniref:Uncharacterized protein n=1 Tax=Mycena metata TaxID=1033252 RepID=A0AAD7DF03_9AGAR|nr:hypothetical protein B0H16DRAFT_1752806 [Mycena metata]